VSVVHAVPADDGFPADVYVDGVQVVEAFVFKTATEPIEVPAGRVTLGLYAADADPDTEDPVLTTDLNLEAGASYTIVANVSTGTPQLALYQNDLSMLDAGRSRITLRNVAAVGAVEVDIDGVDQGEAVEPNQEFTTVAESGARSISVIDGTGAALVSRTVEAEAGALTAVYVVGDAETPSLLSQSFVASQVVPTAVPAGSGGDKAAEQSRLASLALVAGVAGGVLVLRRRHIART
jgi:hypothetical protein